MVTESLIEMFKSKATTSGSDGNSTPSYAAQRGLQHLSTGDHLASPDSRHHPSHTSPSVHKTRLYSPYATNGQSSRHSKGRSASVSSTSSQWPSSATSPRPPPSRLRPLADMNKFLGAVFNEDGSIATQIPRSALGLPGIHTFDEMAENGGVKVESMAMSEDAPVSFPTAEEVMIGGCMCGEGCQCPGCATHSNPSNPHGHAPGEPCGESCKSCFNCGDHLAIPSGVASIEQLIQMAAAHVPAPPQRQYSNPLLDPLNTRVLPPAAHMSENVGRAFGVVQLKPLECCNGRCQCKPGDCKCDKDCCGCCAGCACGEDGDVVMAENRPADEEQPPAEKGCCGSKSAAATTAPAPTLQTAHLQPASAQTSPNSLSPSHAGRQPSPSPGSPSPSVRRNSSVSRAKEASNGHTRGSSVSQPAPPTNPVQRSTSLGSKPTAKSLALHPHHPRPILPKPSAPGSGSGRRLSVSSGGARRLSIPRSGSISSRQPSPILRPASSQASSQNSPVVPPILLPSAPEAGQASNEPTVTDRMEGMTIGVDDIASALNASQVDFMSYLSALMPPNEGDMAPANPQASQTERNMIPPDLLLNGSAALGTSPAHESSSISDLQQLIANTLEQQGVLGNRFENQNGGQQDLNNYLFNLQQVNQPPMQDQVLPQFAFESSQVPQVPPAASAGALQLDATGQPPVFKQDDFLYQAALNQMTLQVPQLQTGGSSPTSGHTSDAQSMPAGSGGPHTPNHGPGPGPALNPDIIDLSKPLNPMDIDRILQALNRQTTSPSAPVARPAQGETDLFDQFTFDPNQQNAPAQDWLQFPGVISQPK